MADRSLYLSSPRCATPQTPWRVSHLFDQPEDLQGDAQAVCLVEMLGRDCPVRPGICQVGVGQMGAPSPSSQGRGPRSLLWVGRFTLQNQVGTTGIRIL